MGMEFNDICNLLHSHCFLLIIVLSDFSSLLRFLSRKVTLVHILKWFSSYEFFRVETYLQM